MRLFLTAEVTKKSDFPWINTLKVRLGGGATLTIDRDETWWSFKEKDGKVYLEMEWKGIYLWALNDESVFEDNGYGFYPNNRNAAGMRHLLQQAILELEIEDDCEDEDYEVIEITDWELD